MLNPVLFTNNMVFQKGYPIHLIGNYEPNEKVIVSLYVDKECIYKKLYSANKLGELNIYISKLSLNESSFDIHVSTSFNTQILKQCRFGYVFLSMGQSNMAFPLKYIDEKELVLNKIKDNQEISFLSISDAYVEADIVKRPLERLNEFQVMNQRFMISEIDKTLDFSAIMTVFAINYYEIHKTPIGIIDVSVGGTSIATYLPKDAIESNPLIKDFLTYTKALPITENHYTIPAGIYNEKVNPLKHLKFEGVFWYQGEHHVGSSESKDFYRSALKELINSYRKIFNQPNLKWINIQLQNHYYPEDKKGIGISLINEAMVEVSNTTNNVFTIPIHDHFPKWTNSYIKKEEANPIHPTNKEYIGKRLADIFDYTNDIIEVENIKFKEDYVLVKLNQEITQTPKNLFGFTLGYSKGKLKSAHAHFINNREIKVYIEGLIHPEVVTYGFFLYNSKCQIYGKHNIPLKPFRSGKYSKDTIYYQPYGVKDLSKLTNVPR